MKMMLLGFLLALSASCQNSNSETNLSDSSVHDLPAVESRSLAEAKNLAKQITDLVGKEKENQITRKQLDLKAMPMQKRLDSIRLNLNTKEAKNLDSFRAALLFDLSDKLRSENK